MNLQFCNEVIMKDYHTVHTTPHAMLSNTIACEIYKLIACHLMNIKRHKVGLR